MVQPALSDFLLRLTALTIAHVYKLYLLTYLLIQYTSIHVVFIMVPVFSTNCIYE